MEEQRTRPLMLRLNTLENSRRTLCRLMRLYAGDKLNREKYKDLLYGCSVLLSYFKTEFEQELEQRIETIEAQLEGLCDTGNTSRRFRG